MLTLQKVDPRRREEGQRFVQLPYRLYKGHPQWGPPLMQDIRMMLNRDSHPFYEHSDADFFIATRDGRDVGRIASTGESSFNAYHSTRQAQFYLFDCEDDPDAAEALFERVFDWARHRERIPSSGPKGSARSMATGSLSKAMTIAR